MQNKCAVTFTLNCDIHPSMCYPKTFLHFILYETLFMVRHWIVLYMYHNKYMAYMYAYTKRTSECGATTPSKNSLRLTHNMLTLKQPLSVKQRLLATAHCRHALHVRTHVHVHKHTGVCGADTLDNSNEPLMSADFTLRHHYKQP